MTNEEAIENFNPNGIGIKGNLFGLPFTPENASLVVIPVPWEVTVSYNTGTAQGPKAVLEASVQLDLAVQNIPDAWKLGVAMLPISTEWEEESKQWRDHIAAYIKWLASGKKKSANNLILNAAEGVNGVSEKLNAWVKEEALALMEQGKMVAVLGGDHSTPYGLMQALDEKNEDFGILQIDAHADLREAYEGFEYSHASVMYNALKLKHLSKLVQVGIRDFSDSELSLINKLSNKIHTWFYNDIQKNIFEGNNWNSICNRIIADLPQNVYISFDIDGLDPKLCPNTGTPVPGGFEFHEIMFLIEKLVKSGRKIIGFDVCEVAPGKNSEWDGNVGARVLYMLSNFMAVSQEKLNLSSNARH